MSKLIKITTVALGLTVLAACGHDGKKKEGTAEETPAVSVAQVEVDSVTVHKDYPAYLTANNTVNIVCRVNGTITSVNYTGGDYVKKGQVLFTIEPTAYRDALTRAEASLQEARSQHQYAVEHYAALKKAFESDAVSRMELKQGENAVEQAKASIKSAEAAVSEARMNLSYCTIRAEQDGQISNNILGKGSYCGGEGNPVVLATIYDYSSVSAEFTIDDDSYMRMLAGELRDSATVLSDVPVKFSVELPHSYTGVLSYIAPEVNKSTGTVTFKCRIENPYGELKEGMYVTVSLPMAEIPDAILVRDASIGTDQQGQYLYTVTDSNTVAYTPVKVGEMANDTMRIVTSGLARDSRYVTQALLKVRNGMKIDPIPEK